MQDINNNAMDVLIQHQPLPTVMELAEEVNPVSRQKLDHPSASTSGRVVVDVDFGPVQGAVPQQVQKIPMLEPVLCIDEAQDRIEREAVLDEALREMAFNCTSFPLNTYINFNEAVGVSAPKGNYGETIWPTCVNLTVGKVGRMQPNYLVHTYPGIGDLTQELANRILDNVRVDEVRISKSTPYNWSTSITTVPVYDIRGSVLVAANYDPGMLRDIWTPGLAEQPLFGKLPKCRRYADLLEEVSLGVDNRHKYLEAADWCPFDKMFQLVDCMKAVVASGQATSTDTSGYWGEICGYHIRELESVEAAVRALPAMPMRTAVLDYDTIVGLRNHCVMICTDSTLWYNSDFIQDALSGRIIIINGTRMTVDEIKCGVYLVSQRLLPVPGATNGTPFANVAYPGTGRAASRLYSPNSRVLPRQYLPPNNINGDIVPNSAANADSLGQIFVLVGIEQYRTLIPEHGGPAVFPKLNFRIGVVGGAPPAASSYISNGVIAGIYAQPLVGEGLRILRYFDNPAFRTLRVIKSFFLKMCQTVGHMGSIFLGYTGARVRNVSEMIRQDTGAGLVLYPLNCSGFSGITRRQRFSQMPVIVALMNALFSASDNFARDNNPRLGGATHTAAAVALAALAATVAGATNSGYVPYISTVASAVVEDLDRATVLAARSDFPIVHLGPLAGTGCSFNGYYVDNSSLYKSMDLELAHNQYDAMNIEAEFKLMLQHGMGAVRNHYNISLGMLTWQTTPYDELQLLPANVLPNIRVQGHFWEKLYVGSMPVYNANTVMSQGFGVTSTLYGISLPGPKDLVEAMGVYSETFRVDNIPFFTNYGDCEAHCMPTSIYMTVVAASQVGVLQFLPDWEGLPLDGIAYQLSDYEHMSRVVGAVHDPQLRGNCYTTAAKLACIASLPSLLDPDVNQMRAVDSQYGEMICKDPYTVQAHTLFTYLGFTRVNSPPDIVTFDGDCRVQRQVNIVGQDLDVGTLAVRGRGGLMPNARMPPAGFRTQAAANLVPVPNLFVNPRTLVTYCPIADVYYSPIAVFNAANNVQRSVLHHLAIGKKFRMGPEVRVALNGEIVDGLRGNEALKSKPKGKRPFDAFGSAGGAGPPIGANNLQGAFRKGVVQAIMEANRNNIAEVIVVATEYASVLHNVTSSIDLGMDF